MLHALPAVVEAPDVDFPTEGPCFTQGLDGYCSRSVLFQHKERLMNVESSDLQKTKENRAFSTALPKAPPITFPAIVGIKPSNFCRIFLGLCSHQGGGNAERSYGIGEALWKVAKLRGALLGYVRADIVCLGSAPAVMGGDRASARWN